MLAMDETAIRAASATWSKAAESKDLETSISFFADRLEIYNNVEDKTQTGRDS